MKPVAPVMNVFSTSGRLSQEQGGVMAAESIGDRERSCDFSINRAERKVEIVDRVVGQVAMHPVMNNRKGAYCGFNGAACAERMAEYPFGRVDQRLMLRIAEH